MDKKAQFYIIASVIIVLIILGLAGVTNYVTTKEEPVGFYDLGGNIGEGGSVIVYGIYQEENVDNIIKNFSDMYASYTSSTGETFELTIVYGNRNNAKILSNFSIESSGSANLGEFGLPIQGIVSSTITPVPAGQEAVRVKIGNNSYDFTLKDNEDFLFVISTSQGYEKFVKGKTE